jgi:hypothetical protein
MPTLIAGMAAVLNVDLMADTVSTPAGVDWLLTLQTVTSIDERLNGQRAGTRATCIATGSGRVLGEPKRRNARIRPELIPNGR